MGLSHDHAHEIVRLRIHRGDPHCVAGMVLGFQERPLVEQHQGKRLRRHDIVGVEAHYSREERLRGRVAAFRDAKLVEHRERADMTRRNFQQRDELALGFVTVARRQRGARRMKIGSRPLLGPLRRPVESTAAPVAQAAATWARRTRINTS